MTKSKINPAAVGVFIAGALVILCACIVVFGGGRFFRKTKDLLLTFREPVAGLDLGAPVKLMGVTVGSVKDIGIEVDEAGTNLLMISVVIEVDRESSGTAFRSFRLDLDDRESFDRLVRQRGLRGQLEILSLLSGQLYVALDMFPDEEGFQLNRERDHGYWEIPTLPSTKRQVIQSVVTSLGNIAEFDFKGTSEELKALLADLRFNLDRMELDRMSTNLSRTLSEVHELIADPRLKGAITKLNGALTQFETLGQTLNGQVNPLLAEANTNLKKVGTTFDEATKTLRQLQAQVEPDSTLSRELIRTLEEARQALNALRQLAQELERNPSSLITGKKEPQP